MLLTNIDIKEAEKFKTYLSEKAPSGVSTYIKTLKAAWGVAVSWKYTDFNPFAKLKIKKKQKNKPSYLTKEEMELIIIHITSKVIKRIIKFAFYTGLRRQELLNIKYYDIDFDQKQLRVGNDTWNTKTSTQRFIPLCDRALEIIEACECKSADQFLFRKEGGGNFPYTGDYVSTQFRKAKISAGIKKSICFHSLRASTATILAELNTPPHIIQRILGHSTIQTTSIYLRPSDESLQKAISKLDGIN